MAVTSATFREAFPVFANPAIYPPATVEFWLGLGAKLLNAERWGDLYDYGLQLFAAHNLSLDYANVQAGMGAGAPGQITGPVTSANVDKVGYSRDPGAAMDPKNGHWNLSTYGLRYIRLVNMVGAGPIQVGVPAGASNYGWSEAWPGIVFPLSTP